MEVTDPAGLLGLTCAHCSSLQGVTSQVDKAEKPLSDGGKPPSKRVKGRPHQRPLMPLSLPITSHPRRPTNHDRMVPHACFYTTLPLSWQASDGRRRCQLSKTQNMTGEDTAEEGWHHYDISRGLEDTRLTQNISFCRHSRCFTVSMSLTLTIWNTRFLLLFCV